MASTQSEGDGQPGTTAPPRWRLFLGLAVLVVTALLILAAAAFPPTPAPTGGGAPPCLTCYAFSILAGPGGSLTFNGTVPGPAMTVPRGATVSVRLIVSPSATGPQSWMLVPANGTPSSTVVFPGANTTDPGVGTPPGGSQTITFIASASGSYKYVCGVDRNDLAGMWGRFNVTA